MSLNILSIDVGMKNLAICLFNVTNELNYKIENMGSFKFM